VSPVGGDQREVSTLPTFFTAHISADEIHPVVDQQNTGRLAPMPLQI
jgi:hypothetical protein